MKKGDKMHFQMVGLRWGRMLEQIYMAKTCVMEAYALAGSDLVSPSLKRKIVSLSRMAMAVEQAAWEEWEKGKIK